MKVEISIQDYKKWAYADYESVEEFLNKIFVNGWKGVRVEFKTIADMNIHGYLPRYIFLSGFDEAYELCGDEEDEISPDCEEANKIEIDWVD